MKKLFKKINVFALAVILIAGVAIITQSAFTGPQATAEYGQYLGVWYNLADAPPAGKQYDCLSSQNVCTVIYEDGAPDQGGTFVSNGQLNGTFRLIDAD